MSIHFSFATISQNFAKWRHGVRLYLALIITLVSLETWWWAHASFAGSSLYAIRLEEAYAWQSVFCLGAALAIGPACKVFRQMPGKVLLFDSRRLFGIGAAWFACLHAAIAYISLFKLANPLSLPTSYRDSFLYAGIALLILLAMAFTSFDRAMRRMGVWWYRLHRLVYVVIILTLLHAFISGTHAARPTVLLALGLVGLVLVGMHLFVAFKRTTNPSAWRLITLGAIIVLLIALFQFGYGKRSQYQVKVGVIESTGYYA